MSNPAPRSLVLLWSILVFGCAANITRQKSPIEDSSMPSAWPEPRKVPATKVALGAFQGQRTILSALDSEKGKLEDGRFFELHTITLTKGQRATFRLESDDFDPFLLILRRQGDSSELLARDDDSGGGMAARLEFAPPEPSEYLVVATTASTEGRGNYTLAVEVSGRTMPHAAPRDASTPVSALGQTVQGVLSRKDPKLEDGSPFQVFEFDADAGTPIDLRLSSSKFDTFLALARVTDKGYEPIAQNDDDENGGSQDSRISTRLLQSGRLAAIATTFDPQGSGEYQLTIGVSTETTENWTLRYPGGGSANGRFALVVGVDDYPGEENDLPGCVNDSRLFSDVLVTRFGFEPKDLVRIRDREATREHLIAAIRGHLGQAGPDGVAVLFFSGHGTQLEDNVMLTNPEDPEADDGKDESIAMWSDAGGLGELIDDEIGQLLGELQAGSLLVVLDTCHSGTASRDVAALRSKLIDRTKNPQLYPAPTRFLDPAKGRRGTAHGDSPGNHVLLAATAPGQLALAPGEPWSECGCTASLFTHYLVGRLRAATSQTTLSDVMEQVRKDVLAFASERGIQQQERQVPQAEGEQVGETLDHFLRYTR